MQTSDIPQNRKEIGKYCILPLIEGECIRRTPVIRTYHKQNVIEGYAQKAYDKVKEAAPRLAEIPYLVAKDFTYEFTMGKEKLSIVYDGQRMYGMYGAYGPVIDVVDIALSDKKASFIIDAAHLLEMSRFLKLSHKLDAADLDLTVRLAQPDSAIWKNISCPDDIKFHDAKVLNSKVQTFIEEISPKIAEAKKGAAPSSREEIEISEGISVVTFPDGNIMSGNQLSSDLSIAYSFVEFAKENLLEFDWFHLVQKLRKAGVSSVLDFLRCNLRALGTDDLNSTISENGFMGKFRETPLIEVRTAFGSALANLSEITRAAYIDVACQVESIIKSVIPDDPSEYLRADKRN